MTSASLRASGLASLLVLLSALQLGGCSCAEDGYLPPINRGDAAGSDGGVLPGTDAGPPPSSNLPCDVAMVLSTYCAGCHGGTPAGGAPVSLMTHDQLVAPSRSMPALSEIELSIQRMRATAAPMPPLPAAAVPEADIAILEAWLAAGSPTGSCELPTDPFAGPDTCTSGTRWLGGNFESPLMRPGGNCIECHTSMREGPRPPLTLAGTVYASGREVDDCNGLGSTAAEPLRVEVTDMAGNTVTMTPNAAGNFFSQTAVVFPITAVVRYQGRERRMMTPVASGDCNSCHTLRGLMMAPGRIVAP